MAERDVFDADELQRLQANARRDPATGRFLPKSKVPPPLPPAAEPPPLPDKLDPFIAELRDQPESPIEDAAVTSEEDIGGAGDTIKKTAGGAAQGASIGGAPGAVIGAALGFASAQVTPESIGSLEGKSAKQSTQSDDMRELLNVTKGFVRQGIPVKDAVKTVAANSRM